MLFVKLVLLPIELLFYFTECLIAPQRKRR